MDRLRVALAAVLLAALPAADAPAQTAERLRPAHGVVVPVRTLRPGTLIEARDLAVADRRAEGALQDLALAVGMEAAVALYPNRPVYPGDLAPPTLVDRNQIVRLVFDTGSLRIVTEGRALDRAPAGGLVRVMNLASRTTVTGTVDPDGSVRVGPPPETGS